jgi:predicted dinucleotide-binding enzyme
MKVGVLGSGQVAQVLAKGFHSKGHAVHIGSRDPQKVADFARSAGIAPATFAEAAAAAELVVLAVKGGAARQALELAGAAALAGKIVIDVTNPIADAPPDGPVIRFFTGPNESLMESLQAAFPAARLVKAWSSVGAGLMVDPKLPGGPPTMFIAGDDAAAKRTVTELLGTFGWDAEDMGPAAGARAIEPLCVLWCIPGFLRNDWAHAFKLLRP